MMGRKKLERENLYKKKHRWLPRIYKIIVHVIED